MQSRGGTLGPEQGAWELGLVGCYPRYLAPLPASLPSVASDLSHIIAFRGVGVCLSGCVKLDRGLEGLEGWVCGCVVFTWVSNCLCHVMNVHSSVIRCVLMSEGWTGAATTVSGIYSFMWTPSAGRRAPPRCYTEACCGCLATGCNGCRWG